MRPSFLSADTHQVKVIQVVGNDVIHGINITLAANLIPVENVNGGAKVRTPFGQGVILGGLPIANEDIMG